MFPLGDRWLSVRCPQRNRHPWTSPYAWGCNVVSTIKGNSPRNELGLAQPLKKVLQVVCATSWLLRVIKTCTSPVKDTDAYTLTFSDGLKIAFKSSTNRVCGKQSVDAWILRTRVDILSVHNIPRVRTLCNGWFHSVWNVNLPATRRFTKFRSIKKVSNLASE